ncbi:MAG TPA: SDR family oxidoreductase [Streptosporangiaceae bacterium]|nr:SDR family oxidoreductase [Streptosporangiaceae bacterium]
MVAQEADRHGGLFDLSGRNFIVTGAGRGLGRGMALAVAAAGAGVVAVARTMNQVNETASADPTGRTIALPADVADLGGADQLIAQAQEMIGPLDGIVHAAGVQHRAPADEVSVSSWRNLTTVNLDAPFFLSTALHRSHLRDGLSGAHVFIGSLASVRGLANIAPYAASKSGVLGIVRTLAVEWASSGTRVNGIAPGYFRTHLTADLFSDAERAAWVLDRIPLGRLGEPGDLAGAVVFLLSASSAYVTGHVLAVDGGWLAG